MSGYDDPAWRAEQQQKANDYYEANRIAELERKYGETMHLAASSKSLAAGAIALGIAVLAAVVAAHHGTDPLQVILRAVTK